MNRTALSLSSLLMLSLGCDPSETHLSDPLADEDTDGEAYDDDGGGNATDQSVPDLQEPSEDDALWCLTWESGTLADAGYEGREVELWDGGRVFVVQEGQNFSALNGEEGIDFIDDWALVLRSSHDGDPDSVAIATSPTFVVEEPLLWWWQVSEVDGDGIALYADLMGPPGEGVLASMDIPVETGGNIPGKKLNYPPVEGYPEIHFGPGQPGVLTWQAVDMSDWIGEEVRLRLYQHTKIQINGFFTAFDDICHGPGEAADALAWGPVDPTH